MNRNVEIKVKIPEEFGALIMRVDEIADQGPGVIEQIDVFFLCMNGRLKLRVFPESGAELIFYQRPDGKEPRESRYVISKTDSPGSLREVLKLAYGEACQVRKMRVLFLVGRTRIHLDSVEGLGCFLELEVVLAEDEQIESGVAEAHELLEKLGLSTHELVSEAYVDLIAKQLSS